MNCATCGKPICDVPARIGYRRCCSKACLGLYQSRIATGMPFASSEEMAQARRQRKRDKARASYATRQDVIAYRARPALTPEQKRARQRERLRAYYAKSKVKQMVRAAKWRAMQAGVPFNLTEHDIEIPLLCPVLGIPIVQGSGRAHELSPALDRVVPRLGYVRGNVRVISGRANTLKRDGTLEEFRSLVQYLEAHGHIRTRAS